MSLGQFLSRRQRKPAGGHRKIATKSKNARRPQLTSELLEQKILLAADTIAYDSDPSDPSNPLIEFASLDFVQGTSFVTNWDELFNNQTPIGATPTVVGDVLFQTRLNNFVDNVGNPIAGTGLNSTFELTVTAEFRVFMQVGVGGFGPTLQLAPNQSGSSGINVYQSPVNSIPLSSTPAAAAMFSDGDLILHADVNSYFSSFDFSNPALFPPQDLDSFVNDDWANAMTLQGSGGQAVTGDPDMINTVQNYLLDPNTGSPLTDKSLDLFRANGNSQLEFRQTDPSQFFWNGVGSQTSVGLENADGVVNDPVNGEGDGAVFQSDLNASIDYASSAIHGFKFEDYNNNGIYEPGDSDGDGTIDVDLNPKVDGNQFDTPWTPTTVNGRRRPEIEFQLFTDEDGDGVFETQYDVDDDGDDNDDDSQTKVPETKDKTLEEISAQGSRGGPGVDTAAALGLAPTAAPGPETRLDRVHHKVKRSVL